MLHGPQDLLERMFHLLHPALESVDLQMQVGVAGWLLALDHCPGTFLGHGSRGCRAPAAVRIFFGSRGLDLLFGVGAVPSFSSISSAASPCSTYFSTKMRKASCSALPVLAK